MRSRCYAIGAKVAYIYIRGEFLHVQETLERAIAEAYQAGHLGKNIHGSGFDCDVFMHRGAGAYEAGEETALIESLEGKRAQPRIKPPFPAVEGLYNCPTAVNNVETLCNVPLIVLNGPQWFAGLGPEKNGGPKLFCISGQVKRPGTYEASMHTTLRELIFGEQYAQGMKDGRAFKAIIPGGSSVPILLDEGSRHAGQLRSHPEGGLAARFRRSDRDGRHGLHGVAGDEPAALLSPRILRQVHPVPRGRRLALQAAQRVERGEGQMKDIDLLFGVATNIVGKTLCAFGDAAATPVLTTLNHFRSEFEAHIREGRCTLPAEWRAHRRQPMLERARRHVKADPRLSFSACNHGSATRVQLGIIGLTFFMLINASALLVLAERKIMGFMQQRYGPYLVGPHGLLQPLADILKLLMKEELRPKGADKWLFSLAPLLSVTAAFAAFATVPWGAETTLFGLLDQPVKLGVSDINVGVLVVFAITSMGVYGIVLAGWASNSKYSLMGGLRASAQMISYELAYATSLAAVILLAASLSLREIVDTQAGTWFGFIPQLVRVPAAGRLHHLCHRRCRRDQPRAV